MTKIQAASSGLPACGITVYSYTNPFIILFVVGSAIVCSFCVYVWYHVAMVRMICNQTYGTDIPYIVYTLCDRSCLAATMYYVRVLR